jgi:hypothetical protein
VIERHEGEGRIDLRVHDVYPLSWENIHRFIALRLASSTWSTSWSIVTSSLVAMIRIRPRELLRDTSASGLQVALAWASSSKPRH